MRLVNKLQTFKPIYMAIESGGLGIGGRDPHPIRRNQFWKVRTHCRQSEESVRTADGSGQVNLVGGLNLWVVWIALQSTIQNDTISKEEKRYCYHLSKQHRFANSKQNFQVFLR